MTAHDAPLIRTILLDNLGGTTRGPPRTDGGRALTR